MYSRQPGWKRIAGQLARAYGRVLGFVAIAVAALVATGLPGTPPAATVSAVFDDTSLLGTILVVPLVVFAIALYRTYPLPPDDAVPPLRVTVQTFVLFAVVAAFMAVLFPLIEQPAIRSGAGVMLVAAAAAFVGTLPRLFAAAPTRSVIDVVVIGIVALAITQTYAYGSSLFLPAVLIGPAIVIWRLGSSAFLFGFFLLGAAIGLVPAGVATLFGGAGFVSNAGVWTPLTGLLVMISDPLNGQSVRRHMFVWLLPVSVIVLLFAPFDASESLVTIAAFSGVVTRGLVPFTASPVDLLFQGTRPGHVNKTNPRRP
ncbi:hypothetical protein Hbl1158_11380 [Halobaculum sp. CBA1158]|uniref:hypothetical protein n=1 Tax=Halobaculum sp. CBA1158 TaxID=2904243 RepID=UPI001F21426F|nr:hypothetical protein [Halobaculum sp. CBA1158]UIO99132.1 hypothetical protein Hbl1158_11380 [Halobaculum sp. CBA1158]